MNATRESETAHNHLCDRDEQQRKTIARTLAGFEGEAWVYDPPILDGVARESSAPDMYLRRADAVLAALHTRTVAQVKAEAWDEAVTEACCESCGCLRAKNVPNPYRADELEREDGR